MTRIAKGIVGTALVASLICASAAQAKQSKDNGSSLKSKCTVAAVVFGTGLDLFGGSSSCSMLSDKDKADAARSKPQQQVALPIKSK